MNRLASWFRGKTPRDPEPPAFRSPWTGECWVRWRCGVHGDTALGELLKPPHHCRGVWGDPDVRECDDWVWHVGH